MKIVISTGLSWLRVPVAINLFCKQLQAVNRQPSWSAFTKFKRDYSKYCIMYLTICYKSSSFAQFIQKWTVLSQNFWLYWTFFVKFGNFWLNQSFLKKIGHFRLNWAFWLKAQFCKISKFKILPNVQFQHSNVPKSSKIPRLKYIEHLIEHMFRKKIESLSIFGLPRCEWNRLFVSSGADWISNVRADLGIWLFERMEVKSKKNFVQN